MYIAANNNYFPLPGYVQIMLYCLHENTFCIYFSM